MNLRDLIDTFRSDAGDTVKPYLWSEDEVIRLFNEAESEACIRARLIYDTESPCCELSVAAGDMVLDLDRAIFEIAKASLVDANGDVFVLDPTDRIEMDRVRPAWRTESRRPDGYIHDDKRLQLNAPSDAAYTLRLEVFRLPSSKMVRDRDEPEIADVHHLELVNWVMHKAFSKPDADVMDTGKATVHEAKFERYFGKRPNASLRRRQNANRPHRNKPCW